MDELTTDRFRALDVRGAMSNDRVVAYYLQDRRLRLAVAMVDDRLYAFDDLCTCADERCPLSGGLLAGTTIMCQCHGSRFDIRTGAVLAGPATEPLRVHEVQEIAGTIHVRV